MKQSKAKIGGGYFKDNKSPSIKITTTLTLKEIKNFLVLCCDDFVFSSLVPLCVAMRLCQESGAK